MKFIKCESRGTYINVERIETIDIAPCNGQAPYAVVATLAGNRRHTICQFDSQEKAEEYLLEYLGITDGPMFVPLYETDGGARVYSRR
jgi:hypothetical protein